MLCVILHCMIMNYESQVCIIKSIIIGCVLAI